MKNFFQKLFTSSAKQTEQPTKCANRDSVQPAGASCQEVLTHPSAQSNLGDSVSRCSKKHVHIGNIGTKDVGKSTLTRAIAARAKILFGEANASCADSFRRVLSAKKLAGNDYALTNYQTGTRHCFQVDPDSNENVFSLIGGDMPLDVVLAVVSWIDGPMPGLRDMLVQSRVACTPKGQAKTSTGVTLVGSYNDGPSDDCKLVVFLNKTDFLDDDNRELLRLVEDEVLELSKRGFWHPKDITIIHGSADLALRNPDDPIDAKCIDDIIKIIEECKATAEQYIPG